MLCPFQKIIIKLDIFGHPVTKDTETATIKETFVLLGTTIEVSVYFVIGQKIKR